MSALPARTSEERFHVALAAPDDFDGWRDHARQLVMAGIPPEQVTWGAADDDGPDLFGTGNPALPKPLVDAPPPRASRAFLELARKAALHADPARFAVLYRVLWRLQRQPGLMEDRADGDVLRLGNLARVVRRDIHKMHAFVRFSALAEADGSERYVAWFEPEHHILRATAGFFVNRFTNMAWSILTPGGSLHWDGAVLLEGPPSQRPVTVGDDPVEDLWRGYYASIFNPARLKVAAMLKEMPRKYWKNLPEAALIPGLVAGAQAREMAMVARGETQFPQARPETLAGIARDIQQCRRCEIGCNGTRAVMGEGPATASLMIVGEQPGDVEEQQGRPFVGPAGQLLRQHLADAGLSAEDSYVTNAVKHFKFTAKDTGTGTKRRLHQTPSPREIDTCRWWAEGERSLVQPDIVLALGASAARSVLGKTVSVQKLRGQPHLLDDGVELWITTHPSYLLRLDGEARERETGYFAADLRRVAERLAELG